MICPHCGAEIDNSAKFCKFCGESVLDAQPVYTPPVQEPQPAPSYVNNVVVNTEIPPQYKPLTGWAYFGLNVLYAIPLIGFIFLLVFTFSDKNINRRNHARSYWCALLVGAIISVIFGVLLFIALKSNGLTLEEAAENVIDNLYY